MFIISTIYKQYQDGIRTCFSLYIPYISLIYW